MYHDALLKWGDGDKKSDFFNYVQIIHKGNFLRFHACNNWLTTTLSANTQTKADIRRLQIFLK